LVPLVSQDTHHGGPVPIPALSTWNLWWNRCHRDGVFPEKSTLCCRYFATNVSYSYFIHLRTTRAVDP